MSDTAQLLETLLKDTDKSINNLESKRDFTQEIAAIEAKYDEASKIKDQKERDLRIQILDADFRNLREAARQEEQDLAQAVFGLNAILEGMGQDYVQLGKMSSEEENLIKQAETKLEREKLERLQAEQTWNILGRRDRAVKQAETELREAEQGVQEAQTEARRRARQRLMSASMEQSLQDFMHRVSKTIQIMETRMVEIDKQLKSVAQRKTAAFDVKQKAAEALERLDEELNVSESDLKREEEALQTMINGTKEHADQTETVSNLRAKVEELRGRRNTAFVLFQSKEKFAAELEIHEKTQMKLRDNQRMWITSLKSDTEERIVTFRSRLEAMKAMADQDVAKQLDDLGAAVDQSNAEYMARAGSASDRVRMEKIEAHPERVAKIAQVQANQAEAIQQIRIRERDAIEKFKKQYGIDPTKSSFFTYEGGGGADDAAGQSGGSGQPSGLFQ
jgi:hypothetical protein